MLICQWTIYRYGLNIDGPSTYKLLSIDGPSTYKHLSIDGSKLFMKIKTTYCENNLPSRWSPKTMFFWSNED